MYRRYTTTGTNKETGLRLKVFFWLFWICAAAGSRIVYFFSAGYPAGKGTIADTYGYFACAMVRSESGEPALDSGLAYAYTKNLQALLRFTGNRIEAVGVYQMILQILWLILLAVGLILLAGWLCGVICGGILLVSPAVLDTMLTVSAGNYYLLHVSIVLVILGCICRRITAVGGLKGDRGRLCLIAAGFYVGVICIWNCLGLFLLPVAAYVLAKGYLSGREKQRTARSAEQNVDGEDATERSADRPEKATRSIRTGAQALAICEGIFFGIFVTLMRYTGVTGQAILEQLGWWLLKLRDPLGQLQDIQLPMILWLVGGAGAGIGSQLVCSRLKKSRQGRQTDPDAGTDKIPFGAASRGENQMLPVGAQEETEVEEQGNYVTTQDGRRIRLLDNPLPGPKKHVRREMEFDITDAADEESRRDDFDIQIPENDDFDI